MHLTASLIALMIAVQIRPSVEDCRVLADCDGGTARWRNLGGHSVGPPGKRGAPGPRGVKGEPGIGVNITALKEQLEPDNGPTLYYVANSITWDIGKTFCRSFGKTLCSFDQICIPKNGERELINDVIPGDHWAPVLDDHNEWVEIGHHHVHPCFLHCVRWSKPTWGTSTAEVRPYKGYVYCCESTPQASLPNIVYQYIGKKATYSSSEEHCQNQNRTLCFSSEICHQSKPNFGTIVGDMWVAVRDRRNEWMQIGNNPHSPCDLHGVKGGLPSWGTRTDGSQRSYLGYVFCCLGNARR